MQTLRDSIRYAQRSLILFSLGQWPCAYYVLSQAGCRSKGVADRSAERASIGGMRWILSQRDETDPNGTPELEASCSGTQDRRVGLAKQVSDFHDT